MDQKRSEHPLCLLQKKKKIGGPQGSRNIPPGGCPVGAPAPGGRSVSAPFAPMRLSKAPHCHVRRQRCCVPLFRAGGALRIVFGLSHFVSFFSSRCFFFFFFFFFVFFFILSRLRPFFLSRLSLFFLSRLSLFFCPVCHSFFFVPFVSLFFCPVCLFFLSRLSLFFVLFAIFCLVCFFFCPGCVFLSQLRFFLSHYRCIAPPIHFTLEFAN